MVNHGQWEGAVCPNLHSVGAIPSFGVDTERAVISRAVSLATSLRRSAGLKDRCSSDRCHEKSDRQKAVEHGRSAPEYESNGKVMAKHSGP